jgi:recombination DNA repair RAD52 pathway protein
MKTLEQLIAELDANIPRDVISKRDAGGGRKLDYLEGWYVIDRLNQVFGHLNWNRETIEMTQLPGDKPQYRAKVRVTVLAPCQGQIQHIVKEGYGFGSAKGASQDHEIAIKEAETDAFKRAAMQFGRSMGLALYDKSGEYIDEQSTGIGKQPGVVHNAPHSVAAEGAVSKKGENNEKAHTAVQAVSAKAAKDVIRNAVKVLEAQKKLTTTQFKDKYKVTGTLDSMPENEILALRDKLSKDYPELKLN